MRCRVDLFIVIVVLSTIIGSVWIYYTDLDCVKTKCVYTDTCSPDCYIKILEIALISLGISTSLIIGREQYMIYMGRRGTIGTAHNFQMQSFSPPIRPPIIQPIRPPFTTPLPNYHVV